MEEKDRALLIDGVEGLKERVEKQGEALEELTLETECMNEILKTLTKIVNKKRNHKHLNRERGTLKWRIFGD